MTFDSTTLTYSGTTPSTVTSVAIEISYSRCNIKKSKNFSISTYSCIENCQSCSMTSTCDTCSSEFYLNNNKGCSSGEISNCEEYDSDGFCMRCPVNMDREKNSRCY